MQFPAVLDGAFHRIAYKESVFAEFVQAQDFLNPDDGASHRFHQPIKIHAGRHRTHRSILCSEIEIIRFRPAWRRIEYKNFNLCRTETRSKIEAILPALNVRLVHPRSASFANRHSG